MLLHLIYKNRKAHNNYRNTNQHYNNEPPTTTGKHLIHLSIGTEEDWWTRQGDVLTWLISSLDSPEICQVWPSFSRDTNNRTPCSSPNMFGGFPNLLCFPLKWRIIASWVPAAYRQIPHAGWLKCCKTCMRSLSADGLVMEHSAALYTTFLSWFIVAHDSIKPPSEPCPMLHMWVHLSHSHPRRRQTPRLNDPCIPFYSSLWL